MDTQQGDNRGIHSRKKVADGVYKSPSWCMSKWTETLDREEKELARVLAEKQNKEYALPWRRKELDVYQCSYGNTGKSIYAKLITLFLEGKIDIEFAKDAGRLAMTRIDQGFMGIMRFVILEKGALDQGADDYGEIHTMDWCKQVGIKTQYKTVSNSWRTIGMIESKTMEGVLHYTFYPGLRDRKKIAMNKRKRNDSRGAIDDEAATPLQASMLPIQALVLHPIEKPGPQHEEDIAGTISPPSMQYHAVAAAEQIANEYVKKAKVAELRANATGTAMQVVKTQCEIKVLNATIEITKAESNDLLAKAAVLLVDAGIEKDGDVVAGKCAEAAELSRMAHEMEKKLVDSNIHTRILALQHESTCLQTDSDTMRRRADEMEATSSLLMMAGGV